MKIKKGDIFFVNVEENKKRYFQYITNDTSQLNSNVVRVFVKNYELNDDPRMEEVISGEIDFYSHCMVKFLVKFGLCEKVGNSANLGNIDSILFRGTNDYGVKYGEEPTKISNNWFVWKIGEHYKHVGKLVGENIKADIGVVVSPFDFVRRIKTGDYGINYPSW